MQPLSNDLATMLNRGNGPDSPSQTTEKKLKAKS
jgi:hypothetical protein